MMKVQMFQMYCGESILVSNDDSCLLIDCGSHSSAIKSKPLFDNVINTLYNFKHKEAMITHFHEDHINGFMYITDDEGVDAVSFEKVYIPHIFKVSSLPYHLQYNVYNVVDYMLMCYYLDNKNCPKHKEFTLLELLRRMVKSQMPFTLLERGNKFTSYGNLNENEVLWPVPEELKFYSENIMLPKFVVDKIFKISNEICELFVKCSELQGEQYQSIDLDIEGIYDMIKNIDKGINESSDDKYLPLADGKYILKADYEEYYKRDDVKKFFKHLLTTMKVKDNETSIVFQSTQPHYLFTGDITKKIMENIVLDFYSPSIKLFSEYEAVKAPHHGTKSHYVKSLFDLSNKPNKIKKVFISNGNCKTTGAIATLYSNNQNFNLICSNCESTKCNFLTCKHNMCPLCNHKMWNLIIDI